MKIVPLILLMCYTIHGIAQTDTVYIVRIDTVFASNEMDEQYKSYLSQTDSYTNQLWKINLIDAALFRINLAYEYKLGKSWSTESYLGFGDGTAIFEAANGPDNFQVIPMDQKWTFEHQFKYYYDLDRRKRLGKPSLGFNGNAISASFWYENYKDYGEKTDSVLSTQYRNFNIGLKYSVQRRYADIFYTEFFVGLYYRWSEAAHSLSKPNDPNDPYSDHSLVEYFDYFVPVLGVRAGIAFD